MVSIKSEREIKLMREAEMCIRDSRKGFQVSFCIGKEEHTNGKCSCLQYGR